jgi:hypothetical protein
MSADDINTASGADNSAADQSGTSPTKPAAAPAAEPTPAQLQEQMREMQARLTRAEQENASLRGEMEAVRPYVRYGSDQAPVQPAADGQSDDDVDPVVKLQSQVKTLGQDINETRGDLIFQTFLLRNPDLADPMAQDLVTAEFPKTLPGRNVQERLNAVATKVRQQLKDRDAKVLANADAERKKRDQHNAHLEGVMDGGVTPPTPSEPDEKADLDTYSAMRRKDHEGLHGGGA